MDTIRRLTVRLGIPCEFLVGSRIKVSGAVVEGEMIYYEALHDGIKWEIISETEIIFCTDGFSHPAEEFLFLGQTAIQWLVATKNGLSEADVDEL